MPDTKMVKGQEKKTISSTTENMDGHQTGARFYFLLLRMVTLS